jgi:hypothetical protein
MIKNKYFVYKHTRQDTNEVFYIGIGTKRSNSNYARAYSKLLRNQWWLNIVNKTGYSVEILEESDDRNFIFDKEKEYIKFYGRRDLELGTLCNLTDGGEGAINTKVSQETRLKHSKRSKGNNYRLGVKHSEETKLLMSLQRKGVKRKPFNEESKLNCRNGQLGSKKSQETINKHIERSKIPTNCNRKPCKLIDTTTNEEWVATSLIELSDICPISLSTLKKLKSNKSVTNKYKKYKFITL